LAEDEMKATGRRTARYGVLLFLGVLCLPIAGAATEVEAGATTCPDGWVPAGEVRLTAYVLATEEELATEEMTRDPCGLEGVFATAFLYGSGVRMQGSGRALDGSIIHYRGGGCFERLDCARTASGRCAVVGRTVATDPEVFPLGSELWIEGVGRRVAEDTGGGIRGRHIDVFFGEELTLREASTRSRTGRAVCLPAQN
jgi:hypothetical protein